MDVLTAEPIMFDSFKKQIETRYLLATIGYPQYGFPWIDIDEGIYAWDGSLLSNTPIREVMVAHLVMIKIFSLLKIILKNR